ncbi:sodium:solute symporter [Asaia astilbis]|uniref:sodium:solute symporter n=1 Tax=Asaia astilbis TaxID=610244 RepID=UPI0004709849|nr:sodium:solute symporter [Asaia astilbis]
MRSLDSLVIVVYFAALSLLIWRVSRKARSSSEDFLSAKHDLPWWALCLSLVATETSTLTFISIPGVGYTQGLVFLGIAAGYCLGRSAVAIWFLPRYAQGRLTSAYALLGERYGASMQRLASGAFLVTRFLAESIRLLAGALPVVWLFSQSGLPLGRWTILAAILIFTLVYTVLGGLRAVVWSDAIQLGIYGFGAVFCVIFVGSALSGSGWHHAWDAGMMRIFHPVTGQNWWRDPFTFAAAVIGGGILSVASHGTDQLMVQRVLAARSLREARLALIGSAFVVALLFGLLSLLGVQLWIRQGGQSLAAQGLGSPDELFPHFIVQALPAGVSGLLIAGVLSATMGSLSSTLNAMAGASLTDFGPAPTRWIERMIRVLGYTPRALSAARFMTLIWGAILLLGAALFTLGSKSAVILGLTIAGWSYGPTLGAFLCALFLPKLMSQAVRAGFLFSLLVMATILIGGQLRGVSIAFPWLVPLGILLHLAGAGCYSVLSSSRSR